MAAGCHGERVVVETGRSSVASPASIAFVEGLYGQPGNVSVAMRKGFGSALQAALAHVGAGPSYMLAPFAAGGFVAHPEGHLEVWFACAPSAASHMRAVLRVAQLTLADHAQNGTVRIFARVQTGWRPGERIARLLAMRPSPEPDATGCTLWEHDP